MHLLLLTPISLGGDLIHSLCDGIIFSKKSNSHLCLEEVVEDNIDRRMMMNLICISDGQDVHDVCSGLVV